MAAMQNRVTCTARNCKRSVEWRGKRATLDLLLESGWAIVCCSNGFKAYCPTHSAKAYERAHNNGCKILF